MCELPTAYSESKPKARKSHRCCECRGTISPGECYQVFNGCWDGRWDVFKTCEDCNKLRIEIHAYSRNHDEGIVFGKLYEVIFESRNNSEWVISYMQTRSKRNAPLSPNEWMEKVYEQILASKPAVTN